MKILILIVVFLSSVAFAESQEIPKLIAEDIQSSEKIITGAPFMAEAIITSTQILADGTKINHTAQSKLYRDAAGRFRRDDSRQQLNIPGANVEIQEATLIINPVAGYSYSLNTNQRTYRRYDSKETGEKTPVVSEARRTSRRASSMTIQSSSTSTSSTKSSSTSESSVEEPVSNSPRSAKSETSDDAASLTGKPGISLKKESLGTRTIEGLNAEGVRTTAIIPAGRMGNDRPITVVYEKWFSKEIMMTVLSKRSDPRLGEQEYRLINISRAEPPLSVFSPPAGYTRVSGENKPQNKMSKP